MRVISVLNLKGGVAKTFTAANVAYELYRRGYRVLLIDNDKQGNLSKAYSRYDAENIAPVTKLLAGDWDSVEDEYGRLCGWYPLRAERCEVIECEGQLYLRYLFANGSYGAIEFERVGIMTDFEYKCSKELYGLV